MSGTAAAAPALSTTSLGPGTTATDLAQQLVGAGVTVTSATFTGDNLAGGTFTSADGATPDSTIVGFPSGVILASGDVANVVGPNDEAGATTSFGGPGDPFLTTLVGAPTNDAAVLDVTFVPTDDAVSFQYVFGSEEYEEFVGSAFNDVFAFTVNGVNCATVGSPPVPVAINTINPSTNSALYRANVDAGINTQLDGLTTVLSCAADVNPGVPNILRMAIADTSDFVLDSAVFIKAGSFVSGPPNGAPTVTVSPASGDEGSPIALTATATDPENDTLSYVWSAIPGPGVDPGASCSFSAPNALSTSMTCTDDGPFTARLAASDGNGNTTTGEAAITVSNVAPTLAITSPADGSSVAVGAPVTLGTTIDDAGDNDSVSCSVDWGDGSPAGPCGVSHSFGSADTFTVTATATDDDGASTSRSITLVVTGAPAVEPLTVTKTATTSYERLWSWKISKSASKKVVLDKKAGKVGIDYTVAVEKRDRGTRNHLVEGKISVTNPNPFPVPFAVTDTLPGATCSVDDPPEALAGETTVHLRYRCAFTSNPKSKLTNRAVVAWGGGSAEATAPVDFSSAKIIHRDGQATVTDALSHEKPRKLADRLDRSETFSYRRYLRVPDKKCVDNVNVVKVIVLDDDGKAKATSEKGGDSATASVRVNVCPLPASAGGPPSGEASGAPKVTVSPGITGPSTSPTAKVTVKVSAWNRGKVTRMTPGARLWWKVRVTNDGTTALDKVTLNDRLSRGLRFRAASGATWAVGKGQAVSLRLGRLEAGQTHLVKVVTTMAGRPRTVSKKGSTAVTTLCSSVSVTVPAGMSAASASCVRMTGRRVR